MKSKIRKALGLVVAMGTLVSGSITNVSATSVSTGNSTSVDVQVLYSNAQPDTISVTVPTALAITVWADSSVGASTSSPKVYLGSNSTTGQSEGTGYLTFKNSSRTADGQGISVDINDVTVSVIGTTNGGWKITDSNTNPYEMRMTINTQSLGDIDQGDSSKIDLKSNLNQIILKAPTVNNGLVTPGETSIPVTAHAGGQNQDYQNATGTAHAFTFQWSITRTN